jgi:hypothetical protein
LDHTSHHFSLFVGRSVGLHYHFLLLCLIFQLFSKVFPFGVSCWKQITVCKFYILLFECGTNSLIAWCVSRVLGWNGW